MNLRMSWRDTRLEHLTKPLGGQRGQNTNNNNETRPKKKKNFEVLSPNLLKEIWYPDSFFDHAISVDQPTLISPLASLRIYNDSTLRYSAR